MRSSSFLGIFCQTAFIVDRLSACSAVIRSSTLNLRCTLRFAFLPPRARPFADRLSSKRYNGSPFFAICSVSTVEVSLALFRFQQEPG